MAASSFAKIVSPFPIIVICGATGTGKSKLAVEIAKKFNGEIISADSMQVYQGLRISTNKVTAEEEGGVPHHMMDFVNPLTGITVVAFRNKSLQIIDEIIKRNRLPILVGGTMYYIEAILYDLLVAEPKAQTKDHLLTYSCARSGAVAEHEGAGRRWNRLDAPEVLTSLTAQDLYKKVMDVDPEMAGELHPGDKRKLIRCLEVYETCGQKMSTLLRQQRLQPGGDSCGGPLRFPNSVMLWLRCDKDVLNERLDRRVDKMMEAGLVQELIAFHDDYNRSRLETNEAPDYSRGIFQAIGFKEFHDYLVLDDERRMGENGKKLLDRCVEKLKISTRKYANKQLKWIKNRFLRRARRQVPPIYELDATDESLWNDKVYAVAEEVVDAFLGNRKCRFDPLLLTDEVNQARQLFMCDICNRYFVGHKQFDVHLKGAKHRKVLKDKNRAVSECQTLDSTE